MALRKASIDLWKKWKAENNLEEKERIWDKMEDNFKSFINNYLFILSQYKITQKAVDKWKEAYEKERDKNITTKQIKRLSSNDIYKNEGIIISGKKDDYINTELEEKNCINL